MQTTHWKIFSNMRFHSMAAHIMAIIVFGFSGKRKRGGGSAEG